MPRSETHFSRRSLLRAGAALPLATPAAVRAASGERLPIYRPRIKLADIYFPHPAAKPLLRYNHDADVVKFRGRYIAMWNANAVKAEHVPGQFNYLRLSDDFEHWSTPIRPFTREGGAANPIDDDNQWQPSLLNYHDRVLYCAWCSFTGRRTFVSSTTDGVHWTNHEVPTAPRSLEGQVVGFPCIHGLITGKDVLLIPCSLPFVGKFVVGNTKYAAMLRSTDGGKSWSWGEPLEGADWAEIGENPAEFGEHSYLWEPSVFEQGDGRIGLLIRNSTAQDARERMEKAHRMIFYATSADEGLTWTKARPIEVESTWTRNFTVSKTSTPDDLVMVMNDMQVRNPPGYRLFLSLYCAPVCDPDLLLPGPLVQPEGGIGFYPSGFVEDGRMYIGYTYPNKRDRKDWSEGAIHSSIIEPLPDYSRPFLLPRESRAGLHIDGDIAYFRQRPATLGLVLTAALTHKPELRLAFDINMNRYTGQPWTILTLGGLSRGGTMIRAIYDDSAASHMFQAKTASGAWEPVAPFQMKQWNHVEVRIERQRFDVRINNSAPKAIDIALLRKIAFGGLYETAEWPMGISPSADMRLRLDTIAIG